MSKTGVLSSFALAAAVYVGSGLFTWSKSVPLDEAGPQLERFVVKAADRADRVGRDLLASAREAIDEHTCVSETAASDR